MEANIAENINKVIEEHLIITSTQLPIISTQLLYEDLNADSISNLEIAMTLEMRFSIHISDEQIAKWKTVADIHKTIEELLS